MRDLVIGHTSRDKNGLRGRGTGGECIGHIGEGQQDDSETPLLTPHSCNSSRGIVVVVFAEYLPSLPPLHTCNF